MNQQVASSGTVGKALEILDNIAALGRPVRFSELLETSPHPKATLYRFLQTLTNQQMLSYDRERQTYTLGIRLVRLAHAAWKQASIAPIARAHLDALAARVGETVHLAQMEGGQVLYVDKRNAADPIQMFSQAGKIGPGYCTGVGKAIMAFLDDEARERALGQQAYFRYTPNTLTDAAALERELGDIRREGVSFDREEHEPGIICIAAPILTPDGRVIGGLSITTSTARGGIEGLETFRPPLLETAARIGADAGDWQFPAPN